MKKFFNLSITDILGKIIDYFCLNIIFILTSLPIITIGASCSALYYTIFHIMDEEDSHLIKKYWKAWKSSFLKNTVVWTIGLISYVILYMIFQTLVYQEYSMVILMAYAFLIIALYLISTILIYYFSLHARFENTIGNTLKNALILAVSHLPVSLFCVVIILLPILLLVMEPSLLPVISCFMVLFGFAVQCRLQSILIFPLYKGLSE